MVIDLRKVQGRLWPEIGSCQSSVVEVSGRRSVVSDSLWPHGPYRPWTSPGQNTGVGSLSLLQRIFPIQGSNPGLPHCRQILYQLNPPLFGTFLYVVLTSIINDCQVCGCSLAEGDAFWLEKEEWAILNLKEPGISLESARTHSGLGAIYQEC